jgi:hypothetical protein
MKASWRGVRVVGLLWLLGAPACAGDDTSLLVEIDSLVPTSGPLEVVVSSQQSGVTAQRTVAGALPGAVLILLPAVATQLTVEVSGAAATGQPLSATGVFTVAPHQSVTGHLTLAPAQADGGFDFGNIDFGNNDFANIDLTNADFAHGDLAGTDLAHDLSSADLLAGPDMSTPSCATAGAVVLCDDFEKATLDATTWTADATATIDTMAHRGAHSLKVHLAPISSGGIGDSVVIETKSFPPTGSTIYVRAWMYLGSLPAGANRMQVLGIEQVTGSNDGDYFFTNAGDYRLYDQFSGQTTMSAAAPPTGSWFCVIFQVALATGNTGSLTLGGTLSSLSQPNEVTQGSPQVGRLLLGPFFGSTTSAQPALDVWFDDVIVDVNPVTCAQ